MLRVLQEPLLRKYIRYSIRTITYTIIIIKGIGGGVNHSGIMIVMPLAFFLFNVDGSCV